MFQIIVHIRHAKNHPPIKVSSEHRTWGEADSVFEKFHELYKLGNNPVAYVEMIDLTTKNSEALKRTVTHAAKTNRASIPTENQTSIPTPDSKPHTTQAMEAPRLLEA